MEDELDGSCSMHGTNKKCIIFWSENLKVRRDHLGDLVIYGMKYSVSLKIYCVTVWSDSTSEARAIFFNWNLDLMLIILKEIDSMLNSLVTDVTSALKTII
jgi:hypothetical protein